MRLLRTGVALLLMLSWAGVVNAQSDFFKTATLSDLSARPSGMVLADFDGDTYMDAAVAGSDGGVVVILVGFGDREPLSQIGSFPAGNVPSSIVAGDFNNDGVLDLVVGNVNDASVSFLKGNGDATFGDAVATNVVGPGLGGPGPVGLAAVDLNNDGNLDLVVANEGETDASPGTVSILRGVGGGTFTVAGSLDADVGTRAVAVARIDGDAQQDIAVVNNAVNSVSLYYGQGNFQFAIGTPLTTGPSPKAIALGDLDGDGVTDVITADANADQVSIFRGSGNRMFAARTSASVGTDPSAVTLTDVNGDGRLDIVAANNRSGDVSLIINDVGGLRRARHYVVDQEPLALAVGDMDDDGRVDIVTANSEPSVGVLQNVGDGTLFGVENVVAGNVPESVAIGDLDNDGLADLIAGGSDGRVLVFRALAGGGFGPPTLAAEVGRAIDVAVGNFNRDDYLDLAIADNNNDEVAVLLGRGGGRFAQPQPPYKVGIGPSSLVIGDFDGDRNLDIGVACIGPPALLSVLRGKGDGAFNMRQNTQTEGDTPVSVDAGDFNCDGAADVLVANSASSNVSVMLSNRNGTFTLARKLDGVGSEPNAVAVADFNRDGKPDFAVAGKAFPGSSSMHVFAGSQACDGMFTQSDESGGELISALAARDVTGDRIFDLLAAIQINNQLQASRGLADGSSPTGKFMVLRGGRPVVSRMPVGIAVGDFDGDGRYDVVSANSDASANGLSVATNVGAAAARRGDGNSDQRVSAADVIALMRELGDGDGTTIEDAVRNAPQSPIGVDANGDGRVDRQDIVATGTRIFTGI